MTKSKQPTPIEALRRILSDRGAGTQEDLRQELEKQGLEVNQSTISRHLRRLGAIKTFTAGGEASYQLPASGAGPSTETSLAELVVRIAHNDTMIVIHTSPGSASLIARHLDHQMHGDILGTIAGDDTVFIAPAKGKTLKKVVEEIRSSF